MIKILFTCLVLALCGPACGDTGEKTAGEQPGSAEISPAEDLMREHGALRRILLIYRESARRIENGETAPKAEIAEAAGIVRDFIEGYHEKLEEEYLFPVFRKAGARVELADTMEKQHNAGRRLTGTILKLAGRGPEITPAELHALAGSMDKFVRMYEPHAAREDTVLFPAFRGLVSDAEYEKLGDKFEDREHKLFGGDGFRKTVARIEALEKSLGIYDLGQFTPRS